ncbi:MAG: translation initiation factor IF-2 [Candidatus Aenigmarchaeota archaeon]|nr:translation initiation factor IF-2 [Candidatus Aenigmarchaeota archaeon]
MPRIRQPIVVIVGHVDHGKTTLADKLRGTAIAAKEAGAITQAAGASELPLETIKRITGPLLGKTEVEIPGLLLLDTPGHAAFIGMRKRGGAIADLAILVIDLLQGVQEQTKESIEILKQFKTPFIVAATKLDKINGWIQNEGNFFTESLKKQPEFVKEELDRNVYKLVGQLSEKGFDSERIDRITDFKKQVAIVPCSGITGEGIPELLAALVGITQQFLKQNLEVAGEVGKGSVLEVRDYPGLGTTIDVVLYDGILRKGDWIVVGGKEITVAKVRALLKPKPLKEIRTEKEFENLEEVSAAVAVKIAAPGLENVIAGSSLRAVREEKGIEEVKRELEAEVQEIEFETSREGIIVRADTLGGIEALVKLLQERGIDMQKAEVGGPAKKDLIALQSVQDRYKRVVFCFNVPVSKDIAAEAERTGVKIINSDIIYRLFEQYDLWKGEEKKKEMEEKLSNITLPALIKILPGFVFRQSDPAVVGVEVLEGELRSGAGLIKGDKEIGSVKDLQDEGKHLDSAEKGKRVAVSIEGGVVGRNIREGDELATKVSVQDLNILEELERPEAELARRILSH